MSAGIFILFAGLFLSYTNGANDNFKGVATLFGSSTSNYQRALTWATLTTFLGSLAALFFSQGLTASFSGKGLIPETVLQMPSFLVAVAFAAGVTVYLATLTGFPISTTYALVGGLTGAGLASGASIHFNKLWTSFFLPLLFSPLIALALTYLLYPIFQDLRKFCGIRKATCFCVDGKDEIVEIAPNGVAVLKSTGLTLTIEDLAICQTRYLGAVLGLSAQELLNRLHYLSSGMVSFARGLNDTPKMVALLIGANLMGIKNAIVWVGLTIALGGLLEARKVAHTMSQRITPMNYGQGFTANLVSAFLVFLASLFNLPVSTTHVTCGSIFGIGLISGKGDWKVVRDILISWLITLPLAAILSGLLFTLL